MVIQIWWREPQRSATHSACWSTEQLARRNLFRDEFVDGAAFGDWLPVIRGVQQDGLAMLKRQQLMQNVNNSGGVCVWLAQQGD